MRNVSEGSPHRDSSFVPSGESENSFLSFSSYLQSETDAFFFPNSPSDDAVSKNVESFDDDEPSIVRSPVALLISMTSYLDDVFSHPSLSRAFLSAEGVFDEDIVMGLIDSGANCHILSYDAALKLLDDAVESHLRVLGVNGSATRADVQGRLLVDLVGSSGRKYRLDLGTAHGMKKCPMNLLSLSLLLDVGAVLHLNRGIAGFNRHGHRKRNAFRCKELEVCFRFLCRSFLTLRR